MPSVALSPLIIVVLFRAAPPQFIGRLPAIVVAVMPLLSADICIRTEATENSYSPESARLKATSVQSARHFIVLHLSLILATVGYLPILG